MKKKKSKEILSLSAFRKQKVKMTTFAYCSIYGQDEKLIVSDVVLVYIEGLYIERLPGSYRLIIERNEYEGQDLLQLEYLLYEFYKLDKN
jgi:hypothetical protein